MKTLLFNLPGNPFLGEKLCAALSAEKGEMVLRKFPDGESYVRVLSEVKDREVIVLCSLDRPDEKMMSLILLARTIKELGASHVCLIAPYLAYMRQDTRFKAGESLGAVQFARVLSAHFDSLLTVDPHLHRIHDLSEIYSIPTLVVHAAGPVAKWIAKHIKNPLLLGPDSESGQWVEEVAALASLPFSVLNKVRRGDRDVRVSFSQDFEEAAFTPVLFDDIISTGHTLLETIKLIKQKKLVSPVCVAIHAVFAGSAYQALMDAGAARVITCNCIGHASNQIDLSESIAQGYLALKRGN